MERSPVFVVSVPTRSAAPESSWLLISIANTAADAILPTSSTSPVERRNREEDDPKTVLELGLIKIIPFQIIVKGEVLSRDFL